MIDKAKAWATIVALATRYGLLRPKFNPEDYSPSTEVQRLTEQALYNASRLSVYRDKFLGDRQYWSDK